MERGPFYNATLTRTSRCEAPHTKDRTIVGNYNEFEGQCFIFSYSFRNTLKTGGADIWALRHTASLGVDDAIRTLLSISESVSVF